MLLPCHCPVWFLRSCLISSITGYLVEIRSLPPSWKYSTWLNSSQGLSRILEQSWVRADFYANHRNIINTSIQKINEHIHQNGNESILRIVITKIAITQVDVITRRGKTQVGITARLGLTIYVTIRKYDQKDG